MASCTCKSLGLYFSCVTVILYVSLLRSWNTANLALKHSYGHFNGNIRAEEDTVGVYTGLLPAPPNNVSLELEVTNKAQCDRPVTNFVFIKVHKTASGSTFVVLARFGRNHGMTICYPVHSQHTRLSYLSAQVDKSDCTPALGRNYTLIIHHAIMNKSAMDLMMAPGTRYIGIMREPLEHFRSIFFYRRTPSRHSPNPLGTYLDKRAHEQPGKHRRRNLPYEPSKQKNFQAYTLGFPTELMESEDTSRINEAIKTVADWYSIVLITEHWEESLVLLRRTFCWTMYDILHSTNRLHLLSNPKKSAPLTDQQKETHRRITPIDYLMYDYFNRTFWERVNKEGPQFWDEVSYYKRLNLEVNDHCQSGGGYRVFPVSRWNQGFVVDAAFCEELVWDTGQWNVALLRQFEKENEEVKRKQAQDDAR